MLYGFLLLFLFFLDLVVLVGTRMDDRLVGQAQLDVIFIFLHKSKTCEVPGTRARPVLSGFEPGPRPWQVLGIFMKQRREVK